MSRYIDRYNLIDRFTLRPQVGYHIRHYKLDGKLMPHWSIHFNNELIDTYRYKSRSKFEMQYLLTHMNKQLGIDSKLYITHLEKGDTQ